MEKPSLTDRPKSTGPKERNLNEKQVIKEEVEGEFISKILQIVVEEGLTITNVKESIAKVYMHMEDNAKLKKDYQ